MKICLRITEKNILKMTNERFKSQIEDVMLAHSDYFE